MLTAGAGVAAPMREATRAARDHLAERAEKAAVRREEAAAEEFREEDSESGVIIEAEVVAEPKVTVAVESPEMRERGCGKPEGVGDGGFLSGGEYAGCRIFGSGS